MSTLASMRHSIGVACILASSLFTMEVQAGVITNGSGFISNVTDLSIGGGVYDVSFFVRDTAKVAAQALIWSGIPEFESAITALVSEMNTISTPNSSVVVAPDGPNLAVNNDFFVARPGGNFAHIRTAMPGAWFVASLDTAFSSIVAEFTERPVVTATVPEPGVLGLVGFGALCAFAVRQRHVAA